MNNRYVLIVSTIVDAATDDVVKRLAAHGISFMRLNTENYPFSGTLAFQPNKSPGNGLMFLDGEEIPVPSSVWYRRIRTSSKPEGMDDDIYNYCLQENRAALLGGIMSIPGRWMNHPEAVWQAEFKPYQLSVAHKTGLSIPSTIVTNDPATIRKAFADFQGMIVKPTRTGHVRYAGKEFSIFTSQVLEEHLEELDCARLSPAIYQTLIPKKYDLRVTIVGHRVFTAAIDSQSDPAAAIDWRSTKNPQLPHIPVSLPNHVEEKLLLMMDSMGLKFGAIDMIQTPGDEYIFLEVNPGGQWLWLDDILEFGISETISEWLAGPAE